MRTPRSSVKLENCSNKVDDIRTAKLWDFNLGAPLSSDPKPGVFYHWGKISSLSDPFGNLYFPSRAKSSSGRSTNSGSGHI